jgi:hypothetical protein
MKSKVIFKKGLFFSLGLFLFLGASCNNGARSSIPTYQGMTVSSVSTPLQGIQYANNINQDNPFGDNQQNKIDTRINAFLGNNFINQDFAYFARASETVRVTINIFNPESYVILSFNLNGRRYQSFEFREGSNSTRLLMDVVLSPEVGLQELTLDEIKYIDGTQIKDAILFGEKTVRVGVLYSDLPEVNVVEKTIGKTSLELDIRVTDVNGLIANAPKPLYVFFYDGKTLKQQELIVGENTIVFDKLKPQTVYQYAIATIFDRLDGSGNAVRLFTKEAIQTNRFLAMSLSTTKTSVSFNVTVKDSDSIGKITKVSLLKNNTIVQEVLDQSEGVFSNLFTNNTYIVKTHFSYQFDGAGEVFEETEEQTVVTEANLIPLFSFTDVNPGKDSVIFEYNLDDLDQVVMDYDISLYQGQQEIQKLEEKSETTFDKLQRKQNYTLVGTLRIDYNDGVGLQTLKIESTFQTNYLNGKGTIDDPYLIENEADLMYLNIEQGSYYALTRDLDISSMNWNPIETFDGFLNGNGFSIYGFNAKHKFTSRVDSYGFFLNFNGSLSNISFREVDLDIDIDYPIVLGVIAAFGTGEFNNVSIDGNIELKSFSTVKVGGFLGTGIIHHGSGLVVDLNVDINTGGQIYYGSIIGEATQLFISEVVVTGNINVSTKQGSVFLGAVIGFGRDIFITDVFTHTHIDVFSTGDNKVGGVVGIATNELDAKNIISLGSIKNLGAANYNFTGGIFGYIESNDTSFKLIANAFSLTAIHHGGYFYAGSVYGNLTGGAAFINVYRYDLIVIIDEYNVSRASVDSANSQIQTLNSNQIYELNFLSQVLKYNQNFSGYSLAYAYLQNQN